MKVNLIITAFCLMSFNDIAQEIGSIDSLGLKQGWHTIKETKDTLIQGNFVNDTIHGELVGIYLPNRKVQFRSLYFKGLLNGISKEYDQYGRVTKYINYQMGEKTFEAKFNKKGSIQEEAVYENGILHGQFRSYYSNGKIRTTVKYFAGKMSGYEIYYKKNGKIDFIGEHLNGILINFWKGSSLKKVTTDAIY